MFTCFTHIPNGVWRCTVQCLQCLQCLFTLLTFLHAMLYLCSPVLETFSFGQAINLKFCSLFISSHSFWQFRCRHTPPPKIRVWLLILFLGSVCGIVFCFLSYVFPTNRPHEKKFLRICFTLFINSTSTVSVLRLSNHNFVITVSSSLHYRSYLSPSIQLFLSTCSLSLFDHSVTGTVRL